MRLARGVYSPAHVVAVGAGSCVSSSYSVSVFRMRCFPNSAHCLSLPGLDWSEESGEELEDTEQASPYQAAWSLREALRHERHT